MRRILGIIAIGAGAFLVVLAGLINFYVLPKVAVYPAADHRVVKLEAKNAQYFNIAKRQATTGDLDVTSTIRGDAKAAEGDRIVWDQFTSITDTTNANPQFRYTSQRSAFDKRTGQGINCCGNHLNNEPAQMAGQIFTFGFNVEKRDYKFYNSQAKQALDAKFVGEETYEGVPVYKFEQRVPATKVDQMTLPNSIAGLGTTGESTLDLVYEGVNTYWVDPATGAPLQQSQNQRQTLRTPDGVERLVGFAADLRYAPQTVADNKQTIKDKGGMLTKVQTAVPMMFGLGLILLVAGLLMYLFRRESGT